MKKSLSVILSTTMALSAFSSAALAATSSDFSDLSNLSPADKAIFDQLIADGVFLGTGDGKFGVAENMKRSQFAVAIAKALKLTADAKTSSFADVAADAPELPYIEAAYKAGVANGEATDPITFNPDGNVTKQELAVFLVGALGAKYKSEAAAATGNDATVDSWAQGYVTTALKYKLLENNTDGTFGGMANATRYMLAKGTAAAEAKVAEDNKPPYATKVASVSASNLKEVVVAFDGQVDATTAGDASNYSIAGKTVESASVADDMKSVTLTVQGTSTGSGTTDVLQNQIEYKLTVNNIRAGAAIISATDFKFTPVDAALPVAQSAQALGNQTVKVVFSEPVQTVSAANFKIDGVPVVGYTTVSDNTVIIKVYTKLTNAEHTVTVSGASDYSALKSLPTDLKFTVTEDTAAPTIKAVTKATFEKARLQFSEPVDPATVIATNVYWLSGTTKMYANSATQISDDTYEFAFSGISKLQYATDLYVGGVKDYSGNTIADNTKVNVSPVLDQTRPEVVNATLDDASQVLTVKFNKTLTETDAETSANYVVKDKDGVEVSKLKTAVLQSDNKTVLVTLATALSQGKSYTLEVSGVSDNTTLKNVMLPYTKKLDIADSTGPDSSLITASTVTGGGVNRVVVTYPEVMAVTGDGAVVDSGKYFYSTTAAPTVWKALPTGTGLNITPDGKSVILSFPSDVAVTTVDSIRVQLVKDTNDNYITGLTKDIHSLSGAVAPVIDSVHVTHPVAAKATNKVAVYFDKALLANTVSASDFNVTAGGVTLTVIGATLNADNAQRVDLTLADANKLNEDGTFGLASDPVNVEVKANATTSTAEGIAVTASASNTVWDQTAATVKSVVGNGNTLTVNFNEGLAAASGGVLANYATDLVVTDENGAVLQPGAGATQYQIGTVTAGNKFITINLGSVHTGVLKVAVANPRFITDAKGNVVASQAAVDVAADSTAPTAALTAPAAGTATTLVVTFSEPVASSTSAITDINALLASAINDGTAISVATATNSVTWDLTTPSAPKATITIPTTTFVATKSVVLTFKAGAVKDAAGNAITTTATAVVTP